MSEEHADRERTGSSPSEPGPAALGEVGSAAHRHGGARRAGLALVALAFFALGVRWLRASEGLPYVHEWDEPKIAGRALNMLKTGDLDPHWYHYGSVVFYLHAGVDVAHYLWLRTRPEGAGNPSSIADVRTQFDDPWPWTISHPSFYLWNRGATALLGVLMVLVTFALARRFVPPWLAFVAAALLAGTPLHVGLSTELSPNVPAALFALCCVLLALRYHDSGRARALAGSFLLAGFTFSTRYNLAPVVLAPLLALALPRLGASRAGRPRPSPASLWLWALVLLVPAGFLLGTPFAPLNLPQFLDELGFQVHHYEVAGHGPVSTIEAGWPHLAAQLVALRSELGLPFLLLALGGLPLLLRERRGWILLAFPLAQGALMCNTRVFFQHHFLPLHPFLAIAAAVGLYHALALLGRTRPAWFAPSTALAAGVLVLLHVGSTLPPALAIHRTPETRSRAIDEASLLAIEHGWRRVGVAEELRMHALDLARLPLAWEQAPLEELCARAADFDALILPEQSEFLRAKGEGARRILARTARLMPSEPPLALVRGGPLLLDARSIDPGVRIVLSSAFVRDAEGPGR